MLNRMRVALALAGALTLLAPSANAAMLTGDFSIVGSMVAVNGQTGAVAPIATATGIDFNTGGSTPDPGTDGAFIVTGSSGDFAGFLPFLSIGTIADFSFAGLGSANYPLAPISAFEIVNGLTFDLSSISIVTQNAFGLILTGLGTFQRAGFDTTPGVISLSGNQGQTTFSFSASEYTVPEPASLLLIGSGLAALGARARRRRNQQA